MKLPKLTLSHACRILNIEPPERNLPAAEKADLLAQVKRQYRGLLKVEHPDKRGENGLGTAHDRTVELGEAYRFVRDFLGRRHITITEFFAYCEAKKRASRKKWFDPHRCHETGRFR